MRAFANTSTDMCCQETESRVFEGRITSLSRMGFFPTQLTLVSSLVLCQAPGGMSM